MKEFLKTTLIGLGIIASLGLVASLFLFFWQTMLVVLGIFACWVVGKIYQEFTRPETSSERQQSRYRNGYGHMPYLGDGDPGIGKPPKAGTSALKPLKSFSSDERLVPDVSVTAKRGD